MDIRHDAMTVFGLCMAISTFAAPFQVKPLCLATGIVSRVAKECPASYLLDSQMKILPLPLGGNENHPTDCLYELSCWMAYRFLKYDLCDDLQSDSASDNPTIFATPLSDCIAYRCFLHIPHDQLSGEQRKYIIYKFYRDKGDADAFMFALYFDILEGGIGLMPSRYGRLPTIYCASPKERFYILDDAELVKQYMAIKQAEAIAVRKIKKQFSDRIAPIKDEIVMPDDSVNHD